MASSTRVPPQRGLGVQCLASEVKAGGETGIAWKLACKGKDGPMNGSGRHEARADRVFGRSARLERKAGGKVVKIDEKTKGRWLGDVPMSAARDRAGPGANP